MNNGQRKEMRIAGVCWLVPLLIVISCSTEDVTGSGDRQPDSQNLEVQPETVVDTFDGEDSQAEDMIDQDLATDERETAEDEGEDLADTADDESDDPTDYVWLYSGDSELSPVSIERILDEPIDGVYGSDHLGLNTDISP